MKQSNHLLTTGHSSFPFSTGGFDSLVVWAIHKFQTHKLNQKIQVNMGCAGKLGDLGMRDDPGKSLKVRYRGNVVLVPI